MRNRPYLAAHSSAHRALFLIMEFVGHFAVLVFRVRNQPAVHRIYHPIQMLQRNLADDVRQRIGKLNDVEQALPSLNLQFYR